jgi:hypothetical protein
MEKIFYNGKMYLNAAGQYSMYILNDAGNAIDSTLRLYMNSDFAIKGENDKVNPDMNGRLEIKIESDDLYYIPLRNFLREDNIVTIEDDMCADRYGKKVSIALNEDCIKIIFEYLKEDSCNEFGIDIVNVLYDGRSKIDQMGLDTKHRLHQLFADLYRMFKERHEEFTNEFVRAGQKVKK